MSISAILIGNDTLTSQCGAILLERGHRIAAVLSRAPEVRGWAASRGLSVTDRAAELPEVDWLFSIANLDVLGADVLGRAAQGAINFHDGPLPARAGLNAPVWALLEGEREHAITWHMIEGAIDGGLVLEERRFAIAPDESALTLNTRCFEAALDSFPSVLSQVEGGLTLRPQHEGPRRLHLRSDRPAAMGRLDFAKPAQEVARLVRALDHGRYWNPLTTAKIESGAGVFNVGSAEVATGSGKPGTILSAGDDGLVVACGDGAVRLSRLTCQVSGGVINPATVTGPLALLSADEAARLTALLARVAPHEPDLRRALREQEPAPLAAGPATEAPDWRALPLDAPLEVLALAALRALGVEAADFAREAEGLPGYLAAWVPFRVVSGPLGAARDALAGALSAPATGWPLDLMTRDRMLEGQAIPPVALAANAPVAGSVVTLTPAALHYDAARLAPGSAEALHARIRWLAGQIAVRDPQGALGDIPALTPEERESVLNTWNATARDHDRWLMVHTAFEAQAARTPDAPALAFEGTTLSYGELDARANRAAHVLIGMGVTPGAPVGLATRRGPAMVVGALAILKAGGAYVPMDPAYPAERLALFAEDSGCEVIVTQSALAGHLPEGAERLELDTDGRLALAPATSPQVAVGPGDMAYLIYTSGSTGRPKGVMVEHGNVVNFFAGMDAELGTDPGVWLAVTSLSFDISVLELFWTLARGFKVVLSSDEDRAMVSSGRITSARKMDFSIFFWGNDDGPGPRKYELLLEGARFADNHGFTAVWTPERHFHAFGGPYPNPSVTGAAVAAVTRNIGVRSGSVVLPLHHPIRVAEDWAVIDNLTNGRVGLGLASGWHPDDFVLRPENTPPANKPAMLDGIDRLRRLWRGEGVEFPKADGSMLTVHTLPRPVSKELPIWLTIAGNPDTWREAGRIGANVLTHLLGQSIAEVAEKIGIYHAALREAGHDPADFSVSLMLHTYVGRDREQVRRIAEGPMKAYLGAATALVQQYAWTFPAFKKPPGVTKPMDIDTRELSAEEAEAILDFAFQRYFEDSGLFGTVEDALARVEQLKRIGVTEVACLIDYGIAPEKVLEGLYPLAEVVRRANAGGTVEDDDYSIAAQIIRHGVTHLQCTPSMARMLAMNDDSRAALGRVGTMLVGGEALPGALADDLRKAGVGRLLNMYGPTETTVWSACEEVGDAPGAVVGIGHPLANQRLHVLDQQGGLVGPGVEGDLWIAGEGVTVGYWRQPELTEAAFRPDPFHGGRMYRTGDRVRRRADGGIDFLGRADGQIKLRGHRIEPGEIEAVLTRQPGVNAAVAVLREDSPGDHRLVAYVTGNAQEAALKGALAAELPAHVVPSRIVRLDALPLTPNGKIDRRALPAPGQAVVESESFEAPAEGIEAQLARIWQRVLGVPRVSAGDNFFALGGHSLLAVQAHREIRDGLGLSKVSVTDIFRFPVLAALAAHLEGGARPKTVAGAAAEPPSQVRGDDDLAAAMARRRAMRLARRGVDA